MSMLSVVLAVLNEESNLEACLASVKDFADEIVLVDGGSIDGTLEIAKKYKARIIRTTNPPIFHINKQKALDAAKGDWILQLDADEHVTEELKKQICLVLEKKENELPQPTPKQQKLFAAHLRNLEQRDGKIGTDSGSVVAYFLPRLNFFLGGYLRYGGVYPDGVIRLVKKGKASFPCKNVHEQMEVKGRVAWLSADLQHYADPTFSRYLQRANRYTTLTANAMMQESVPRNVVTAFRYLLIKPAQTFLLLWLRHKGILDGFPGFVWALFSGLHHAIAYMKYLEMSGNE